jgi:purine-nucleoside phosphorylase
MSNVIDPPASPLLDAELLAQAKAFVYARLPVIPRLAIILGSGLGFFAEQLHEAHALSTKEIPGYPASTVAGHAGKWILGESSGKKILAVQGRAHTYEGYPATQIGFMIHLLAELGVQRLILTNAAGGINPHFAPGDLMLIEDHINMMFANPLRGQHRKEWGERWPDMSSPYSPALQKIALQTAAEMRMPLRRGVLLALRGPSYETAAEIRMAKRLGADAVTMSTVPEVLVAVSRRVQVLGLSCVTNMAAGLSQKKLEHGEVTETANRAGAAFSRFLTGLLKRIG